MNFKVGANVSGVEQGGKKFDKTVSDMEAKIKSLKRTLEQLGDGTSGLRKLRQELEAIERALHSGTSASSIYARLANVNKTLFSGGADLLRPDKQLPRTSLAAMERYRQEAMRAGVGYGGAIPQRRGDSSGMAFGSGPVGRSVAQNALSMGLGFGLYGGFGMLSEGMQNANEEAASAARVRHQLKRSGRMGEAGAVFDASSGLYRDTGTKSADINKLIASAMGGGMDVGNATRAARLGLDIEASGEGNAMQFVKALNKAGAEVPEELKRLASALGVETDHTTTLNQLLEGLQGRVGGLSEEIQRAKGGLSDLGKSWERTKTAMGQNLQLAAEGPYKPAIDAGVDLLEGNMSRLGARFGVGGKIDWQQYGQQAVLDQLNSKKITRQQAMTALDAARNSKDPMAWYDLAANPKSAAGGADGAPVSSDGDKPIMPAGKSLRPAKQVPQGVITHKLDVTFRSDPHSPTKMRARGL